MKMSDFTSLVKSFDFKKLEKEKVKRKPVVGLNSSTGFKELIGFRDSYGKRVWVRENGKGIVSYCDGDSKCLKHNSF